MPTRAARSARSQPRLRRPKKLAGRLLAHLVLLAASAIFVIPLLFMVSTSLKSHRQIQTWPPIWIPNPILWRNYSDVFDYAPLHRYFWNTVLIALCSVFGATVTSSLAAYAFARLRAPGRNLLFFVLLGTLMVPGIVTLVPTYIIFSKLGWIDTFLPLTVPALLGSPFHIFLLRQFFMTIPQDLEDAALIDGCSRAGIWWRIMLPLARPGLTTVAVFAFMWAMNDFMGPLIYLNSKRLYTLSLGLQVFTRSHGTEWGMLMAASTMMVTPVILIFFLAQRQFVQGITLTGMKG